MLGVGEGEGVMINKALHDRAAEKSVWKVMVLNPPSCWVAEPTLELPPLRSFMSLSAHYI